ncbi:MAG: NADH-quinone oxidoreductase subunit NuoI [Armatimonadota bacterium]|jgi:NADH-quinone oxidoreductase subunit I
MITELIEGLSITFKHLFRRPVTVCYPEQTRKLPERARWRHVLRRWENGLERCIGCDLCGANCPVNCIYVEAGENTDEERYSEGERYARIYEINMLHCIYCGYCEEACPTGAIVLRDDFRLAYDKRSKYIFGKDELLLPPNHAGNRTLPHEFDVP